MSPRNCFCLCIRILHILRPIWVSILSRGIFVRRTYCFRMLGHSTCPHKPWNTLRIRKWKSHLSTKKTWISANNTWISANNIWRMTNPRTKNNFHLISQLLTIEPPSTRYKSTVVVLNVTPFSNSNLTHPPKYPLLSLYNSLIKANTKDTILNIGSNSRSSRSMKIMCPGIV